jgi:sRNA-binding protein
MPESHTPIARLSHHQVGQSVILKGAFAVGDALVISAIQDDGYYKLTRGKVTIIAAASHEVEA